MTGIAPVEGVRVGVIGLGRSGSAVARLLAQRGAKVFASDLSTDEAIVAAAEELRSRSVDTEVGGHDRTRLAACDWLVLSPGVPPDADILQIGRAHV